MACALLYINHCNRLRLGRHQSYEQHISEWKQEAVRAFVRPAVQLDIRTGILAADGIAGTAQEYRLRDEYAAGAEPDTEYGTCTNDHPGAEIERYAVRPDPGASVGEEDGQR